MKKIEKLKKVLENPLFIIVFLNNRRLLRLSDEKYLKIKYYAVFHKKLDLNNPQTFNEKLQWLKLYDRKDIYTKMVDKYDAKEFIANTIGEEYVIPTLGVYDKFDEIDFEKLPKQFVIKCTHDSGGLVIVKDKSNLNIKEARKKINKALKRNYYNNGREWPYKNVKPRIIVEKYIYDKKYNDLRDYKFYCFNGKAELFYITSERETQLKLTFFNVKGEFLNLKQDGDDNNPNIELPTNLNKMILLAEKISKNIPHLRVDFYEIDNKIYVGELTLSDGSGFGKFEPEIWDKKIGDMIDLSIVKKDYNEK